MSSASCEPNLARKVEKEVYCVLFDEGFQLRQAHGVQEHPGVAVHPLQRSGQGVGGIGLPGIEPDDQHVEAAGLKVIAVVFVDLVQRGACRRRAVEQVPEELAAELCCNCWFWR